MVESWHVCPMMSISAFRRDYIEGINSMETLEVHRLGKVFRFDRTDSTADTWEIWVQTVEDLFTDNARTVWNFAGTCDTAGMLGVELVEILSLSYSERVK